MQTNMLINQFRQLVNSDAFSPTKDRGASLYQYMENTCTKSGRKLLKKFGTLLYNKCKLTESFIEYILEEISHGSTTEDIQLLLNFIKNRRKFGLKIENYCNKKLNFSDLLKDAQLANLSNKAVETLINIKFPIEISMNSGKYEFLTMLLFEGGEAKLSKKDGGDILINNASVEIKVTPTPKLRSLETLGYGHLVVEQFVILAKEWCKNNNIENNTLNALIEVYKPGSTAYNFLNKGKNGENPAVENGFTVIARFLSELNPIFTKDMFVKWLKDAFIRLYPQAVSDEFSWFSDYIKDDFSFDNIGFGKQLFNFHFNYYLKTENFNYLIFFDNKRGELYILNTKKCENLDYNKIFNYGPIYFGDGAARAGQAFSLTKLV